MNKLWWVPKLRPKFYSSMLNVKILCYLKYGIVYNVDMCKHDSSILAKLLEIYRITEKGLYPILPNVSLSNSELYIII